MGFSVSGSFAILALAAFIALGTAYPAVSNGVEQVTDATHDSQDAHLTQQNTDIEIVSATYSTLAANLTVEVDNTGTTTLSVNDTDFVVDNGYEVPDTTVVEGDSDTDVWQPGETLTATIETPTAPSRVKVVSGPGVAAATDVTVI